MSDVKTYVEAVETHYFEVPNPTTFDVLEEACEDVLRDFMAYRGSNPKGDDIKVLASKKSIRFSFTGTKVRVGQ